ncbi:hypothetical protein [Microvirga tunisiensis]|uniref:Uncharacterized protein n=1 Tax=Microvirga tunisiensis TaxID=2108360 RepID=A0A5N7MPW6_9HYPH|nr:hypothetical protein [Microvirga tunisiensis]MPR10486.1 hypothetical protein [Microvirga tunisiensis]MPR28680.1 hypothetical protein [Microvirga tunisiensis]
MVGTLVDGKYNHPSGSCFERCCYCVEDNGNGTGTVVLEWYEISDGQDYMTSEAFMTTTLEAARAVVHICQSALKIWP